MRLRRLAVSAALTGIGSLSIGLPCAAQAASPKGAPNAKVEECEKAIAAKAKITPSQEGACVWFETGPHMPGVKTCPYPPNVGIANVNGSLYAIHTGSRPLRLHKGYTTAQVLTLCSAITESEAGQQYLADIAPLNAAVTAFKGDTNDDLSAIAGEVAPIVSAAQTFESTILRQQWPSNTRADIKTLATEVGTFESDVSNFGSSSASDISSAEQTMVQADGTFGADSNIVRADLGLPPPPS
jgi:hypothetical protein